MNGKDSNQNLLRIFLAINLIALIPILLRKHPIKDWIIVYLFNAVTNVFLDKMLTKYNILRYPVRLMPNFFKINILFDLLVYPTISVIYNQMTYKDKPFTILYKLLGFTIPMLVIELWAEKRTKLIEWGKPWTWYHTILGLTSKSLITRLVIAVIRRLENKEIFKKSNSQVHE